MTWMGPRTFVALALACGLASAAAAEGVVHKVDKSHSRIGFRAYTKLFDVEGRFKRWSAKALFDPEDMTRSTVSITVDAKSVDTDSEGRDNHLRKEDFFYVEKYPKARFVSKSFAKKGEDEFTVTGDLTIRGVTKRVTIPFAWSEVERQNKKKQTYLSRRARGQLTVNRHDYGINYKAGLLLPSVNKNVDIVFDINFYLPPPSADAKSATKSDTKAETAGGEAKAEPSGGW